jgi:ABC-type nitrate/sulfonate/bicarbonate transport system permease component
MRPVASRLVLGTATTAVVMGILEVVSRAGIVDRHVVPPVSEVGARLVGMVGEMAFWTAMVNSLQAWALGLGLSILVGVPVGLLIGALPWLYEWVRTVIEFFRPIPPVALIPLAVLIYGPTTEMKIFLVVVASLWPILFQTLYGIKDVDRVLAETAQVFRLDWRLRARYVYFPTTLPYLVTGLRISATIALIVTIAAELVSGAAGLGSDIRFAQSAAESTRAWALIVTVGLLGLLINAGFRRIERHLLHWHPSQRIQEVA